MDDCHCPDKIGVCPSNYQNANNPEAASFGGLTAIDHWHNLLCLISDLVAIFISFGKARIEALIVSSIISLLECLRVML
ncbi:hypothetical protein A9P44_05795 [Paenibacillus polymyxa]|nr:hypothetical protein A9P44_05795 [Paenibacillus polymyxa]